MTGRAVVVGAGPIGLATAMLLARDGYEVTVLEKDAQPVPVSAADAWDRWDRSGVAQFRQAHIMQAKFRHLLDAEFPQVRDRIGELGGRRFSLISVLPPSVAGAPRQGDERFETLTGRRPVIECAFAQLAEDTAGVKVLRGVGVTGPVTGPSVRPGVPHVGAVRTTDGAEISADLVIDAMGRRSKLCDWITSVGGRPPREEASDAGFAYYTRHFRSRDGSLPEFRGPLSATIGTILCLTVPADNNTWTVAIAAMAGDKPLKALRHNATWERVACAIPHVAHWLDGEPVCDVTSMAGVLDRRRRVIVDDEPAVTGLVPVGDAWACTNPTAGRGFSLGLAHAVALRDVLRDDPHDPADVTMAFDRFTEETLTPWYREQIDRDYQRAAAITSCGACSYCHQNLPAHCLDSEGTSGIGWIFGHLIDGTQAEYVRVPFAESSLHKLPGGVSDEAAVMLSDILPTGFEIGVRNGRVEPGDVVAVIGAGPVGLAAMMTAGLYGASRIIAVDLDDNRVEQARGFGATDGVNSGDADWKDQVLAMTDGLGVDVAIEAVGMPATFQMAIDLVRPGGTVANIGVHGKPVELKLQDLWIKDIAITTGLVSATTTPMLLRLVAQGKLTPEKFVSHRFTFEAIIDAYDTFGRAGETKALKVAITR